MMHGQKNIKLARGRLGILFMTQQPLMSQCLLIIEVAPSHSETPHSVGLLWKSDQPDAKTST